MPHLFLVFMWMAILFAPTSSGSAATTAKPATAERLAYPPPSAPLSIQSISERFAQTDARLKSMCATFRQFARLEGSDTVQSVEGDVIFKKPALMRLTHKIPESQTVVSDGKWLWTYRPSTRQVIRTSLRLWRNQEPLAQSVLDFGNSARLLARYDVTLTTISAPAPDGHRSFTLELAQKKSSSHPGADYSLSLTASTRDYIPIDVLLRVGKTTIRTIFEHVLINEDQKDSIFQFTPPPDAELFQSSEPPQ